MSFETLDQLSQELRDFLLEHVSQTGGHLASNLGAVELTLAIHNIFDTTVDRVVFDVGHQAYVHKILTGRMEQFSTLRSYGGLAGFPKPSESVHDAFTAGHASSAVSVALGLARARTLQHQNHHVLAVVGDGAMTGGLFYEGMNDAGASHEPLIVILNDNGMSISKNVGGISRHLSLLRLKPAYFGLKKKYRFFTKRIPGGKILYRATHRLKERLKRSLIGSTLFEEMGFLYLGPVDGHDIRKMSYLLARAKEERCPVLLHVITKKGKGYLPAEQMPNAYHGVGKFTVASGVPAASSNHFSAVFGNTLTELAKKDPRICAITAGMLDGTGLEPFAARYPSRFFDVGIAEGHAVSMAGGLAKQGMGPGFAVYSSFLQRGYDMFIHDVALQNLHVVFCVDRAGLVGSDGETHHGVFDVSYLSSVPDMTVLCPASYAELETMLRAAIYDINGSVAIRYPRGGEGKYTACNTAPETLLREGRDVTLVCYGIMTNEVLDAAERLAAEGISAEVIKLSMIKPPDFDLVMRSLRKTGKLLISEDVCEAGCVGSRILEEAAINEIHVRAAKLLNLGEGIVPHGTVAELLHDFGLDADGIVSAAMEMMDKDMK